MDHENETPAHRAGTKWKIVAVLTGLVTFTALVVFCISLVKPLHIRAGRISFGMGTREGFSLAPGRITDWEVTKFPRLHSYSWHVKAGKRKLWTFSVTVDKSRNGK